jgi:hypothetical protein
MSPPLRFASVAAGFLLSVVAPGVAADGAPVTSPASPPTPAPAPPAGCTAPEHRQFDFWLGDWVVRGPAGRIVGENRIVSLHKGCVLYESWTGAGAFTGSSLNVTDAATKKWHQTWVDVSGALLLLDGEFTDGRMVLAGRSPPDAQGNVALQRITWSPLADGRVRQLWETSADAGTTWTTAFDGYYSRVK